MNNGITKTKVLSSLLWKLMERGGTQGIQFIITVILARLLLPKEFGLIVIATIFITIAKIFVETGFNTALIQKKEADEIDFSSVFYLSSIVAGLLYFSLFLLAPYFALFFKQPEFTSVLRILSLILFLGAFNSIQIAIISRNLQFKKLFVSSFGAVVISGIVGIFLAYANFGIWALVVQQLTNQIMITLILWFTVKWRPLFVFSITRIKSLFSFGWKLLVSGILDTLTSNLTNLLVGKLFSPAALGFYNRGEQLPSLIVSNIDGSIQSVMLPTLSKYQENNQRVKEIARRSIVTSSFIIFPMMVGLAVIAKPLIELLFTEKWLPSVPFIQISCAVYALWPIHTMNLQVMNALGRSDLFLKLEIVKKILSIAILIISLQFGIYALVWGGFISSILSTFINAYPNKKLINYSFQEQWRDIIPSLLLSLVMGATVYTISLFEMTAVLTLITQVFLGIIIYIGLAKAIKLECYLYLVLTLKELIGNKKYRSVNNEVQLMKRLLILGGNYSQIPVIKKAREMGLHVITCDYLKDNLGHQYADEHYNISYIDKEAVLALAKSLKIDGITCFATDAAATTVAYVAEKLSLPSNSYNSVDILSNKEKFRNFLKDNHFNVPKTKAYNTFAELKSDFHNLDLPVMIKPVDSSASRGVAKIESLELLEEKVKQALSYSMVKRFVIEEFIEKQGYQITGDAFYVNGKLVFRAFANSHFLNSSITPVNPFVPIGPSWPSNFSKSVQDQIHDEIQRLIKILNLKTGALNFDIQIDSNGRIYFLDMGARNGGNLIPTVTKYATGIDMIEYSIKAALGEDCSDLQMVEPTGYWSAYLISSQKSGIFKGIEIDDEIKKHNIIELDLTVKLDDSVFAYTGSNTKLGTIILKFSTIDEMLEKMDNMYKFINIIIEESLVKNL